MRQKNRIAMLLLLLVLCLTACASDKAEEPRETSAKATVADTTQASTTTAAPTEVSFWAEEGLEYPMPFYFGSGVGGWATELYLEADGSFRGMHYDTNLGENSADYPNGTKYICNFTGKFAPAERLDMYTYGVKLEELTTDRPAGEEWIEAGFLCRSSSPYGLEDSEDFVIYLPNTPKEMLSEDALMWWPDRFEEGASVLGGYALYNLNGEYGFYCMFAD